MIFLNFPDEKFALRVIGEDDLQSQSESDEYENINEYMNCLWKQDFSPVASLFLKRIVDEF